MGVFTSPSRGRGRALLLQALVIGAVLAGGAALVHDALVHMARQGIASGFGYLGHEAGFAIGETLIPYGPADSYGRALLVGLLNTLLVAAIAIVAATALGLVIGIARGSGNWLVRQLAWAYVEGLRNVPLLLQLILWWSVLRVMAPPPQQAWQVLPHVFFSNRGLAFPWFGAGFAWQAPVLGRFNFSGGASLSPEFAALVFGLAVYTAAFIAEIVRGGLAGVPRGQSEAAAALGLRRGQALRLVILPQALRIIIPPLIGEYLALTKNSSLAVAIGYPDLTAISYTTLNQTGQAVEAIALMMGLYLALSLATSAAMNWWNARSAVAAR